MYINIDKIVKIKMIKNLQTSTNLLSSFTYSYDKIITEKCNKYSGTSSKSLGKQLQKVTQ